MRFCLICLLGLAACSTNLTPGSPQIGGESVDQVLLRIKQEVGTYQTAARLWRTDPEQDPARPDIAGVVCGDGQLVDFDITRVKLELVAIVDDTDKTGVTLKIPFGPSGFSFGPGYTTTREAKATQTLDMFIYPNSDRPYIAPEVVLNDAVPIARTLIALRSSLIKAAHNKPCMALAAERPSDAEDTFKLAFNVNKEANPQLGFGIYVTTLTAGGEQKAVNENTITVSFKPMAAGSRRPMSRQIESWQPAPERGLDSLASSGPVGFRGSRGLMFFRMPPGVEP